MADQKTRGEHQPFDASEVISRHSKEPETQERIIFISPQAERLLIQLVKAKKLVIDNQVIDQEQVIAAFQDHTYISTDPEVIGMIRNHSAYKRGKITELGQLASKAKAKRVDDLVKQLEDPNVRAEVVARLNVGTASVPTVKGKKLEQ